jgi:antitoxin (DNA-binding transcriptional repressor) of toxin-antitoxin stability system
MHTARPEQRHTASGAETQGRTKRRKKRYDPGMELLHISEGDLAKDVRSILRRVETGAEVIVERDAQPVAVIRPAEPVRRKISECIALLPADSTATIDPDFAKDVEAAIAAHREPMEPPAWD